MVLSRPLLLCFSLSVVSVSASDDFPNLGKYTQVCEPYTCRPKRVVAPLKDFEFTANGCGTSMPVTANLEIIECCNWHDACYSVCGMPKANCENRFRTCMKAKCDEVADPTQRLDCFSAARILYITANMMGCPAFHDAQKKACDCVSPKDVAAATRDRLEYFLQVNGASEAELSDKALDALLAKYKGREHTLFLRLLKRYPDALKLDLEELGFVDSIARDLDAGAKEMEKEERLNRAADESVDEHEEL
uniref:Phospholipase A2 n=1 Tax=Peronospora matthiolae TaxID=2874970 RepID=A0AAV1UVI5_9STRA